MKKKNFVSMIMGTVGGILFAIGMCMCLLPQWNAFNQGIVMGAAGAVILLAMLIVRRKMEGKPAVRLNGKAIGTVPLWNCGSAGSGRWYVHGHGMEHVDPGNPGRSGGNCPAALPDPDRKRIRVI